MSTSAPPGEPLRVLCFSPYPVQGASVRHRICAFEALWLQQSIELTLHPFMSRALFEGRRRFGAMATLRKSVQFALCSARLLLRIPTAARYDAIIIHREAFPLGGAFVERWIASVNPRIIFDVDDAIWNPPSNPINQRRWLWSSRRVPDILRLSKVVVVGSTALSEYARQFNSQVVVVPTTYTDLGEPPQRAASEGPPILLWIGNWGNASYMAPILPVLEELSARYPFRLRVVGGPDVRELRSARFPIEYCTWSEAEEAHWLTTSDVGLMPLVDGPYERGKCAFKLIQYFAAGLPVVASPVGMNTEVVEHGTNGYLASEPAQWSSALEALLADPERRRTLGEHGRATFLERFTRAEHADRWSQILRSVARDGVVNAELLHAR